MPLVFCNHAIPLCNTKRRRASFRKTSGDEKKDPDNYGYDLIGNLKVDASENINNIDWTVYVAPSKNNKIDRSKVTSSGGQGVGDSLKIDWSQQ